MVGNSYLGRIREGLLVNRAQATRAFGCYREVQFQELVSLASVSSFWIIPKHLFLAPRMSPNLVFTKAKRRSLQFSDSSLCGMNALNNSAMRRALRGVKERQE